ncbi:hypothetical protein AUJ38_01930 [bacterium CG1_02_42_9]|nr:MAG: hypothetical protein AUJ38_01930 [bacterium CG1_02_42_9]
MIKGIIFDWLGTLSPGIPEGYFPVNRIKEQFHLDDATIAQCEKQLGLFKAPHQPRTIDEQRQILLEWYGTLAKMLSTKDQEKFIDFLMDWSLEKITPILYSDVMQTLELLASRKLELAILTNGWPTRLLEIQRCHIAHYFRAILISSVEGVAKPEIQAYQNAQEKLGLPANEILLIEDKEKYLIPAASLDMEGLLMDREENQPHGHFAHIKELSGIMNLINKL